MNLSLASLSKGKSSKKMYTPTEIRKLLQNSTQSAKFFNVTQIKPYLKINRPKLTPQKRTMIKEKLQLEREAKIMSMNRQKKKDFYVRYGFNPFINLSQKSLQKSQTLNVKKQSLIRQRSQKPSRIQELENINIIDALWTDRRIKKDETLGDRRVEIEKYSKQISRSVSRPSYLLRTDSEISSTSILQRFEKEYSFDEIVKLKDENYFIKKQSEINIFKIMKGNRENILSNEILAKHHFCSDSTIDKKEKFAVPTYRNISIVGRQFATGRFKGSADRRAQVLKSSEMLVSSNAMTIEDLISVAAGRITPDLAFSIINEAGLRRNKPSFEEKSQEIELEEMYNENTNQKMMNFTINHLETHEIKHYLALQNSLNEQMFAKKCSYFYNNLLIQLKKRQRLCKHTIYDEEEHKICKQRIQNEYEGLFSINNKLTNIERDRMIRMNKTGKTRNDTIKVRQLLQSLVMKNKSQREIMSILKHNKIR